MKSIFKITLRLHLFPWLHLGNQSKLHCARFAQVLTMTLTLTMATAFAQQVVVSPIPQSITWGTKAYDSATAKYHIVRGEAVDQYTLDILASQIDTTAQEGITLLVTTTTDPRAAAFAKKVSSTAEAYFLCITTDSVVIVGRDADGIYYGARTFLQIATQKEVMQVAVADFPDCPQRGVIEGFYGNPWSTSARKRQFDFYGANKMNIYVYGPKDDAYHRGKWRTPYPIAEGKVITELAEHARRNHVEFVWAIHPGGDITWSESDFSALIAKLENVYSLGVRAFSIFFDDISGTGAQADKQAELLNYVWTNFVEQHTDVCHLSMCPTQYNKAYASGTYLNTLGTSLNKNIQVMWTGNSVVDMINAADVTWIRERIQRKPFIWLNYPVNDYCIGHMLMGKTYGNDTGNTFGGTLSAFCSNPMEYAEASKVSLYSIADYAWNMKSYNAQSSWERAISHLMPTAADAFMTFCENNVDLGYTAHGLRRDGESPTFSAGATQFKKAEPVSWCNKDTNIDTTATNTMSLQMDILVDAANTLLADSVNHPEMIEEIRPWVMKMKYMGQRGQLMMAMWKDIQAKQTDAFLAKYDSIKILQQKEDALRSRNFSGTIKMATPVVGEQVIVPFLKEEFNFLVNAYKARFDTGWEHFDPVALENGVYYIKYNGRYLTNANPGATRTGDYPVFKATVDDYNPQKCEWTIAIDATTNRYKIINVEDGRYLNEKGSFWADTKINAYNAAWNSYNLTCCSGRFAIQNAGSAGKKFWTTDTTRISQGDNESTVKISDFIFEIIPVGGSNTHPTLTNKTTYYIQNSAGEVLTDMSSKGTGIPVFYKQSLLRSRYQKFLFTPMSNGRWKVTLKTNGAYLNEHGVFGTNAFYDNWNTYILTECGGLWSIQNAEDAGTGYWSITSDKTLTSGAVSQGGSFVFRFVDTNATGVEGLETRDDDDDPSTINLQPSTFYNLQGIKVDANYKGIVIKNGKKYWNE